MTTFSAPAPAVLPKGRPSLRLALTPEGPRPRLDGAWWPHSRDLVEQLPLLIEEVDGIWGRITRAAVHDTGWTRLHHSVRAGSHDVRVNWFDSAHDPHTITLFSYRIGEWELLVVPPDSTPWRAKQLMAAAAHQGNRQTARMLLADGHAEAVEAAPRHRIRIRARNMHHPGLPVPGGEALSATPKR